MTDLVERPPTANPSDNRQPADTSGSATYRRVVVTAVGGPEVLQVIEEPLPDPGPGQVRIRVQAAGISAHDLMLRRSRWIPGAPKIPYTPGLDVVGVVDALGQGVSTVALGQRVAAGLYTLGHGGYAETVCVPAEVVFALPDAVDSAEAVCLVVNYLTAHAMLHRGARVQRGERVLVHGAAGGVGSALLELGKLMDLEMYGTASARNHDLVSRLGATPIDYRTENFVERIHDLTGDGVDVVFDPIGGARQLWRSYRALRGGGRLVWFGVAATRDRGAGVIPTSVLTRLLLSLVPDGKRAPMPPDAGKHVAEALPELIDLLAAGRLRPVVAARIPLLQAARAHELLERGGVPGKVVLVTG